MSCLRINTQESMQSALKIYSGPNSEKVINTSQPNPVFITIYFYKCHFSIEKAQMKCQNPFNNFIITLGDEILQDCSPIRLLGLSAGQLWLGLWSPVIHKQKEPNAYKVTEWFWKFLSSIERQILEVHLEQWFSTGNLFSRNFIRSSTISEVDVYLLVNCN